MHALSEHSASLRQLAETSLAFDSKTRQNYDAAHSPKHETCVRSIVFFSAYTHTQGGGGLIQNLTEMNLR